MYSGKQIAQDASNRENSYINFSVKYLNMSHMVITDTDKVAVMMELVLYRKEIKYNKQANKYLVCHNNK